MDTDNYHHWRNLCGRVRNVNIILLIQKWRVSYLTKLKSSVFAFICLCYILMWSMLKFYLFWFWFERKFLVLWHIKKPVSYGSQAKISSPISGLYYLIIARALNWFYSPEFKNCCQRTVHCCFYADLQHWKMSCMIYSCFSGIL